MRAAGLSIFDQALVESGACVGNLYGVQQLEAEDGGAGF